ncbi:hypothetical protein TVAG_344430 [Trichomonas vaginalis G3]|uniref:Zona occludens toxin N-terminal domain-containing protein n=17 Tax=Trichomonas vaginalis (strain ATCC PRA-98 / G3) TaxID=412133 RepID=A2E7R4_TRIV3|nr:protein of unknown function, DUF4106 family [Trichomonas vaginalis G3]XP_001305339.1 protein of unknown function, DUF4106 family [Trichomonas vaginalis G3]XP_001306695.1 protein of unknown function, DUF4106 family [Trichomonas vaginalis G3]XP_001314536.1 protein of unknown function, DUF4106 family [Trichomonas vaginalis G3]XP_001320778.2 protein of unknown function, DUF4106 family [Trichomonas vaginalis G3]XP_051082908.1 protein of unknown function, DUF4106 family [Trichomonas vaginalis G3]|eukprot:XP_001300064.1 hypothetical protein [Trichomonas vaginalis G3]
MEKVINQVDKILHDGARKNSKELNNALIMPFSDDYPFCTNGVYFYCGKMGSGKTYGVIRHIMITDRFTNTPYYDSIVISATSGTMDKTAKTFMSQVKAPVLKKDDKELMPYLMKNVKMKAKYYAIVEFVQSKFEKISEEMEHILTKHQLRKPDGKFEYKKIAIYVVKKLNKYPFTKYPSNSLLVLDDYGGHDLLNDPRSPLANFITKVRHYNYTVVIMCQTWRHICLNIKRLCTDFVIFQGYSMRDFQSMIEQSGATEDWEELWNKYKELPTPRSYMEVHIVAGKTDFKEVKQQKMTLF